MAMKEGTTEAKPKPETKKAPVTLKQGMPPQQTNGLFGAEERIMHLGVKGRFVAIVTYEVADIVTSEANSTRRPVLEHVHIEPLWETDQVEASKLAQEAAYKQRTGVNQLDFGDEAAS